MKRTYVRPHERNRIRQIKKYVIEGRRWFDKLYGNTYHTVYITDVTTNNIIYESPMTYGYGSQWQQTAYDWLVKHKLAREEDRFNHELNRKRFIYVENDVSRKKDL